MRQRCTMSEIAEISSRFVLSSLPHCLPDDQQDPTIVDPSLIVECRMIVHTFDPIDILIEMGDIIFPCLTTLICVGTTVVL